jgi:hypothetical protein
MSHHHVHLLPPPTYMNTTEDDAAEPPLPAAAPRQTAAVKEIMSKVICWAECLCVMWSMGHVQERYLQFEKAGDQYLG